MGAIVRIPSPLRRITGGQDKIEVEVSTLTDAIEELEKQFPGMKERLVDENGDLRHFVNIYVNGEDVQFLQGLQTEFNSGDEVSIVPAVAGGS
jgi:molybdopterin synthase sulfur carrier subunit